MSERANESAPTPQPTYPLRFPPGLRSKLQRIADQNRRSLNTEIVIAIEHYVKHNGPHAAD